MHVRQECAFCGGGKVEPLNHYGPRCLTGDYKTTVGHVQNVWCTACGLSWNSQMLDGDELSAFYRGYTKKVADSEEDDLLFGPTAAEVETLTRSQARFVASHLRSRPPGRLLDIGCGKGSFLRECRAIMPDWHYAGIEPSREEAQMARAAGLDIREGMFGEIELERGAFDLISIMHVLEHMSEPAATLTAIQDALAVGGLVFVEVPNVLDLNMFYDLLLFEHLYHFAPETLIWQLTRMGFEVVGVEHSTSYGAQRIVARKHGRPISSRDLPLTVPPMRDGFQRWRQLWSAMTHVADAGARQARAGQRVALFGAGMTAATWLVYSELFDAPIVGCLDESPWKIGRPFFGRPVYALAEVAKQRLDMILVAAMPGSQANIRNKLLGLDLAGAEIVSLPSLEGHAV
jgi:SAM-dependent methyltransferase